MSDGYAGAVNEAVDAERVAAEAEARTVTGGAGRGHYLDPAGSTMAGVLAGGYKDPATGELHRHFTVREMDGEDEDLLGGKGNAMALINQVIVRCLVSIGPITDRARFAEAVQQMPTADRVAVLITLWRASLGDHYVQKLECPNEDCRKEDRYTTDLSSLVVQPMPRPTERAYRTELPSGRVVQWHIMTGSDEEWMGMASRKQREKDGTTLAFLARVDELDGTRLDREARYADACARLKALPKRDRHMMRQLIVEYEGGVDTDVEYECKHCGHQWRGVIPVGAPSFFFPSVR